MKKRKGHIGGNDLVVLLAFFHRYGYFALMVILLYTVQPDPAILVGSMIAFHGLYDIIGALCGFRHIYCSMQDADHQKMTPSIRRYQLTPQMKKELFSIGAIFIFLGLALLIIRIFYHG